MTQTQSTEDPEYIRLPSWTDHNIPGVDTYYGLSNTMFRGVHTNWSIVGPVVHGIHGAECVRYHTYEAAFEAITAAQEVRDLLTRMQNASIDPMGPASAIATLRAQSPAVSSVQTQLLSSQPSQVMMSQVPPPPPRIPRGGRPRGGWLVFAVAVGRQRGIFATAEEMDAMIKHYPNRRGQGFRTEEEALEWLEVNPA
ncbi:hypothetical protein BV25DRAFT_1922192 [Artomyces pyxidatus]|uniref:Uncharacterized protein n=1 Tax=Artomyces pyxidatus TaxID=48021 RepID=A0ACB8SFK1_9AGAM|nr:hypothetical protein BV25DRAFT_1922192 [Artomyces pyxidatus]